jgi:hypothetical protein
MNKKLLFALGIIILVVLGYFALQEETPQTVNNQQHDMGQNSGSTLEVYKETVAVSFQQSYSIDEEWSLIIDQFEPDAKISDPGMITSDSELEQNPAVKVNFYKNGELVHYQIVFKEMPGFHSVKPGQKYLLDFIDYSGFSILGDNSYSIESATLKISRIK